MKKILALFAFLLASTAVAKPSDVITLGSKNTIVLRSEVNEESVSKVGALLQYTGRQSGPVYLYIYSPGGEIVAGQRLVNIIKAVQATGTDLVCVADFAASMAFSILQACKTRVILENGIIMQHQASYGLEGPLVNNRERIKLIEDMANKLNEDDAARLSMSVEAFREKIYKDWWLYDSQAVDAKAADKTALVKCSAELLGKKDVEIIESLFGTIKVTWSACPTVYAPLSIEMKARPGVEPKDFNEWVEKVTPHGNWKELLEVR